MGGRRGSRGARAADRDSIFGTRTVRSGSSCSGTCPELEVKHGRFVHNHAVSRQAFATYPSSRGVDDELISARVGGMLAVGAKRSRIYDYLLEHDQNVLQVDVDNMVRAHSASIVGGDDNAATARELAVFAARDKENIRWQTRLLVRLE